MKTDCNSKRLEFHPLNLRKVVASFDGGAITSDAGALLLREVERECGIIRQFASCFTDHRAQHLIKHSGEELVAQRVFALTLGYEDLNDHDELRSDPLFGLLCEKDDLSRPPAGSSTLNRLELSAAEGGPEDRYKRFEVDAEAVDELFVSVFLEAHEEAPAEVVLDLDATDDPLHGGQEGRAFHGYYRCHCYLPLYIFCGEHLLCARLRPGNTDPAAGAVEELERIVGRIREAWPEVKITVRGDCAFSREEIMGWCEANGVDYVLGFARNSRLLRMIEEQAAEAAAECECTGRAARRFADLRYRTRDSWSRRRRVVAKAEHLPRGANPRFVVTSLPPGHVDARALYEDLYCARGDMENRIKEQQLALFADRTSTRRLAANQLRLWFSAVAYLLLVALRRRGLRGTPMARAQSDTIRLKLFKIGGRIKVTVRRIYLSLSEGYPWQDLFAAVHKNLFRSGFT